MFVPLAEIQDTHRKALDDICGFLWDVLDVPTFRSELKAARDEAVKHDAVFGRVCGTDPCDFVQPFLYWLEHRHEGPSLPWEVKDFNGVGLPLLPSKSKCRVFLVSLLDRLERLTEPSDEAGLKIQKFGHRPSFLLEKLGQFVAANRLSCTLSYNDCPLPWNEHVGFASWLIVFDHSDGALIGDLHILSNIDKIAASSVETDNQARRFEKAYLHELGHARTNLQHYLNASPVDGIVNSRPEHETHAWIYSSAIQAFISGARARICRLLRKGDNEWK